MAPRPGNTDRPDPWNTQQMTKSQRDRLGLLLSKYGSFIPKKEMERLLQLRAGEKAGEFSLTKMWAERAIAKIESYIKPPKNVRPPFATGGFDFWHLPQDVMAYKNALAKAKSDAKRQGLTGRRLAEALDVAVQGVLDDLRAKRADIQPGVSSGKVKITYFLPDKGPVVDGKPVGEKKSVLVAKSEVAATMAKLNKQGATGIKTAAEPVATDPALERIWREGADARKAEKAGVRTPEQREKMQKQARIASAKSMRYTGGPSPSKTQQAALNRAQAAAWKKVMAEFDKAGGAGTPDAASLPKGVQLASGDAAAPMDPQLRGIIDRAIVAAGDGLAPEQRNRLLSVLTWNEAGLVNVSNEWANAAVDKLNRIVDQVDSTRTKPSTITVGGKKVSTKTKTQKAYSPTRTPEEQAAIKADIETRRNTRRNEAVKEAKGAIRDVFGDGPTVTRQAAQTPEPPSNKVRITFWLEGREQTATVNLDKADAWVDSLKQDGAKRIKVTPVDAPKPQAGGAARSRARDAAAREKLIVAEEQRATRGKPSGRPKKGGSGIDPSPRDAGFIDFEAMLRNRRLAGAAPALPKFSTPSRMRIVRPSMPMQQTGGIRGFSGTAMLGLGGMTGGIAAQQSSSYVPGRTGKQFGGGSHQRAGKK